MISMLFRCINLSGNYLKFALFNGNKKMMNFTTNQLNKRFFILVRYMESMPEFNENPGNEFIRNEFNRLKQHIESNQILHKKEITNFIDLVSSSCEIESNWLVLLISWCNRITDCLPAEKVEVANSIWMLIDFYNIKISIDHYNELLKLYVKCECDPSSTELLMNFESKQIYPNSMTYRTLIKYHCMEGNMKEARMILKKLMLSQSFMNESLFNSFLLGYSKNGDIKNVFRVLKVMKQLNCSISSDTYAAILYTYAALNDIVQIERTIKDCILKNIHFPNTTILRVIYILALNNYTKNIDILLQYLKRKMTVSTHELNIILNLMMINQVHIATKAFLLLELDKEHSTYETILKMISEFVVNNMVANNIIKLHDMFYDETSCKKFVLMLLHYSLMKSDHLFLSLLKRYRNYVVIRPHYFWPLMVKQVNKYNFHGILNILDIMINDFNVYPCVETLSDYVLPFAYMKEANLKKLLIEKGISELIIDTAYLLLLIKKCRLKDAWMYMKHHKNTYLNEIIANDLMYASYSKNNAYMFLNIGYNLNPPMLDELICNFIVDFPVTERWLSQVLKWLTRTSAPLKFETKNMISKSINKYKNIKKKVHFKI